MNFIKSIDWFITMRCKKAKCLFCYAPFDIFPMETSKEDALSICHRIKKIGIERVTLCGGEPLLYTHINEVIECLHENQVKVILYAGVNIKKIFNCLKYTHIVSIPFEAVKPSLQEQLRGRELHVEVLETLELLQQEENKPRIKIGTVVNKLNLYDIENIFFKLMEYDDVISTWRLYMFSPYGIGAKHSDKLNLSEEMYLNCRRRIEMLIEKYQPKFCVSFRSRSENKGYCMIMSATGDFYRYEEKYMSLNINIHDYTFEEIKNNYNIGQYVLQKEWHNL